MRDNCIYTFYGWTLPQWSKAIAYHDQLNPTAPFGRRPHQLLTDIHDARLAQWAELYEWWCARRSDAPLGAGLLAADGSAIPE